MGGGFFESQAGAATYDSVAFRFIVTNDHTDHDSIAAFRRRFVKAIKASFVQVLLLAREMGGLETGTVALDGTKIHANASRHGALSYQHAGEIEAQLKAAVTELNCWSKPRRRTPRTFPMGCRSPKNWRSARSACRKSLRRARRSRGAPRSVMSVSLRSTRPSWRRGRPKRAATGKKPRGGPPVPPSAGASNDQINLTDEDSRIMPVAGGGFD